MFKIFENHDKIRIYKKRKDDSMAIFLSVVVFIITFVLLLGSYIVLVANNKIKRRRMDKVLKLVAAYSLVTALVYCYQYLYL